MQGFYQRVLAGLPRALALREAQLELRATRSEPFTGARSSVREIPGR